LIFNVHYTNMPSMSPSRYHSSILILKKLDALGAGFRRIVMGDFNTDENTVPYYELFKSPKFVDTFRKVHPDSTNVGTKVKAYNPRARSTGRIDWIGVSDSWAVLEADVRRISTRDGLTPSDHHPITAVLRPPV
jgi:endonuclease/exonuclease/phosphatase family metal-dependent hydrolase